MPALSPWPNWTQLNDWTADARPDENRYNNCGPESVAACLKYLTGIELPADYVKDVMYGDSYLGYTDFAHLVQFLEEKCEVPVDIYSGDGSTRLQPVIQTAIDAGYPIIVLYFFRLENPASGHYSPVIAYDDNGCTRANVWNGQLETWDWGTFEQWQKLGNCMVLKRTRPADIGTPRGADDPLVRRMGELLREAEPYLEHQRNGTNPGSQVQGASQPGPALKDRLRALLGQGA